MIDSYQVVRRRHPTVLLPLLIFAVTCGLVVFYFAGKDEPVSKENATVTQVESPPPEPDPQPTAGKTNTAPPDSAARLTDTASAPGGFFR